MKASTKRDRRAERTWLIGQIKERKRWLARANPGAPGSVQRVEFNENYRSLTNLERRLEDLSSGK